MNGRIFNPGDEVCLKKFPNNKMWIDRVVEHVGYTTYVVWDGNDKTFDYDGWQIERYEEVKN